jgi:hypothetical protein
MKFNINTVYSSYIKDAIKNIHCIYLAKPKKFTNKTIYEVGKLSSKDTLSKDTELILFRKCTSSKNISKLVLDNFVSRFPRYTKNRNYFVGDAEEMADVISDIIKNERKTKEQYTISGL